MLGYYPGCTVRAQRDEGFEREAMAILQAFTIDVKELSEWECCGAVYPLTQDEYLPLLSSVRALQRTKQENYQGLLTLCSACYHVLKRVKRRMEEDGEARKRLKNHLETPYEESPPVYHLLEVLRDFAKISEIKEKTVAPLTEEKIACYYGCMLLRPGNTMDLVDGENPRLMETILETMGAKTLEFPYRTDCCGSYHSYQKEGISQRAALRIVTGAKNAGATQMVTACPLCKYNLEKCQESLPIGARLRINYITKPMVQAMGGLKIPKGDIGPLNKERSSAYASSR